MKKFIPYSLIVLLVSLVVGMHRPLPVVVANAGADQSVERSTGYAFLDGSGSTGAGLTYTWRLINPNGNQPEEGWIDDKNAAKTSIHNLPYGSGHWDYELTVTDGVTTSKDTMSMLMTWATPPPQASSYRILTAADTAALNVHNKGCAKPGDYYIDGANNGITLPGGKLTDIYTNGFAGITFTPGMHIFINCAGGGAYGNIQLNFNPANITATAANRVIVTGINGQLEATSVLFTNAKNIEFTGKYVQGKSGDDRYKGFDGGYGYQSGTFGVYINNRWTGLGGACVTFSGTGTDSCKMHDIEFGNGAFAGIFMKEHDVDSLHIWNCFRGMEIDSTYGHDTDGEMFYGGDTAGDSTDFFGGHWHWQHVLQGLKIHDNIWVCSGNELAQIGDQGGDCQLYNNALVHGDMRYRKPFDESQDNTQQDDYRSGRNKKYNNIIIGGGEYHLNTFAQTKRRGAGDPAFISTASEVYNNLFLMNHGFIDNFCKMADTINAQTISIHNNYWGNTIFDANQVFTDSRGTNTQEVFRVFVLVSNNHISFTNNISDNTKTGGLSGTNTPQMDSSGNTKVSSIMYPKFANTGAAYIGETDSTLGGKLFGWVNKVYATQGDEYNILTCGKATCCGVKQCTPWTYSIGDLVLWQSKIYKSRINSNVGNMPYPADSSKWQICQWVNPKTGQTVTTPPDDMRLTLGDTYQVLGMGLTAVYTPSSVFQSFSKKRHKSIKLKIK